MSNSTKINSDGELEPSDDDVMLMRIQQFISTNYLPVAKRIDAEITLSTDEIYNSLQRFYPCLSFSKADLVNWLHEKGFTFFDAGQMRFEWMFKSATLD